MDLLEIRWGGVDWIDPAEDRDKWRALMTCPVSCTMIYGYEMNE
jgi:hypothetical protein